MDSDPDPDPEPDIQSDSGRKRGHKGTKIFSGCKQAKLFMKIYDYNIYVALHLPHGGQKEEEQGEEGVPPPCGHGAWSLAFK